LTAALVKIAAVLVLVLSTGMVDAGVRVPRWVDRLIKLGAILGGLYLLRDILLDLGWTRDQALAAAISVGVFSGVVLFLARLPKSATRYLPPIALGALLVIFFPEAWLTATPPEATDVAPVEMAEPPVADLHAASPLLPPVSEDVEETTATASSGQPPLPMLPPARTNEPIATAPTVDPQSAIVYYRKSADGDRITRALEGAGLPYRVGYSDRIPQTFLSNSIACSPNVNVETLRRLIRAMLDAGIEIVDVRQFERAGKQGLEVLAIGMKYGDEPTVSWPYPALSRDQLLALDRCPYVLNAENVR
jgi:hypothetical protein